MVRFKNKIYKDYDLDEKTGKIYNNRTNQEVKPVHSGGRMAIRIDKHLMKLHQVIGHTMFGYKKRK